MYICREIAYCISVRKAYVLAECLLTPVESAYFHPKDGESQDLERELTKKDQYLM